MRSIGGITAHFHGCARFAIRLSELGALADWVRASCEPFSPSVACVDALELSVVEAASNVIQHGFKVNEADTDTVTDHFLTLGDNTCIAITVRCFERAISIDLFDKGRPIPAGILDSASQTFDFNADETDTLPEEMGRGVKLIRACVDEIEYRRRLGVNRLRLVKCWG